MSSLVITLKSELALAELRQRYQLETGKPKRQALALQELFHRLAGGIDAASLDVQTGSAAPVAASGTWTLASCVATDVASVGGVSFTFTSTPTLSTDVEVDVPAAKAFASASDISLVTGYITEASHGFETGDVGQLTTDDTLPAGFSLSTDYWVIKISSGVYQLASSLANALAGIQIKPTDVGVGNQTFTLTADTYNASKLAAAVNAHATIGQLVKATYDGAIVTVTALQKGVVGNFIQFGDSDTTITSSGSGYLAGGTGGATDTAVHYALGIA